jgi:hypothetical protein
MVSSSVATLGCATACGAVEPAATEWDGSKSVATKSMAMQGAETRVGATEIADAGWREESPAMAQMLPPPLLGKKCVTATMLAIFVAELAHEPVNEMGVILLFGMVCHQLGFVVEFVQAAFPDCMVKIEVEPGRWQYLRIEFEYESRTFRDHGHDDRQCDMIVCWRHNWKGCPEHLQVLELSQIVQALGRRRK